MTTPADVADRIRQWAIAAGGAQLQRLGYAAIEAIRGNPPANDPVYNVEAARIAWILAAMERDGYAKEAAVLRAHYLTEALTEAESLAHVRRGGLQVSRAAYYIYLNTGHAIVWAALTFGEPPCES